MRTHVHAGARVLVLQAGLANTRREHAVHMQSTQHLPGTLVLLVGGASTVGASTVGVAGRRSISASATARRTRTGGNQAQQHR